MSGNTFGRLFAVTTFGESHGPAMGCVVDGCPPGLELAEADIQQDLERRRPGRSRHTTQRNEADRVTILSGVFEGRTTGTPIGLLIENTDQRSHDYSDIRDKFRPGHADYSYQLKYGIRDYRGGGRSSARETTMRVAAGAIARKYLGERLGIRIRGYLAQLGPIALAMKDLDFVEQRRLLGAYGIDLWDTYAVETLDEAVAAGEALDWDVVLKATADHLRDRPDLAHVWRNIDTPDEMADAWTSLNQVITDPERAGFVVQRNAPPGVPVTISTIEDPLFGPVLSFGIGGSVATSCVGGGSAMVEPWPCHRRAAPFRPAAALAARHAAWLSRSRSSCGCRSRPSCSAKHCRSFGHDFAKVRGDTPSNWASAAGSGGSDSSVQQKQSRSTYRARST